MDRDLKHRIFEFLKAYGINAAGEYERWKKNAKLGLVVNPIAGMGGRVGLKGTDDKYELAVSKGAKPVSPLRAVEFLVSLKNIMNVEVHTYGGLMGEKEARAAGFKPVVHGSAGERTSAEDTKRAVRALMKTSDIIVFVGGDGTARDICEVIADSIPALGVPSGVKMYSGVFALNPFVAAGITAEYFRGKASFELREVMDIDENQINERFNLNLYGYLKIPVVKNMVQAVKRSHGDDAEGVISTFLRFYNPNTVYILAPGGTILQLARTLGLEKTLLGVDVIHNSRIIARDAGEEDLLSVLERYKDVKIVVTPIGGNGFIFGRGNLQISPEVIRRVGKRNIIVISTLKKLSELDSLKVDTGDFELDKMLKGEIEVLTEEGLAKMRVE